MDNDYNVNNNIVWTETTNSNNYYASVDTASISDYYTVYDYNANNVLIINNTSNPYYYNGNAVYTDTVRTQTTEEKLDSIDIKEIEQYLRKKKIENITKKNK